MTHTLPGHSAPAVGSEVPLEMLAACHGRVQQQCETLLRLLTQPIAVTHRSRRAPPSTKLGKRRSMRTIGRLQRFEMVRPPFRQREVGSRLPSRYRALEQ